MARTPSKRLWAVESSVQECSCGVRSLANIDRKTKTKAKSRMMVKMKKKTRIKRREKVIIRRKKQDL